MDLSIIIVSWNVREKLKENLQALYKSRADFEFEVFVVDNNSEDKTCRMLREEFPQVNLIENYANLGFARANNQVLKNLDTDFVLLLNPDMKVREDTLSKMYKWTRENRRAAIAGCHLFDKAGNTVKHVRRFPRLFDQLMIVLKMPHLFPGLMDKYIRKDFDYGRESSVDSVRGGFMMLNMPLLRNLHQFRNSTLPYFDERYFLWYEEVDLCRQVKKGGGEVWYTPVAECVDMVGQSFKQLKRSRSQGYLRASMLKYFKKWHKPWEYRLLKLAWPVGKLIAVIGEKIGLKHKAKT
jgi:GT2 family glycosyltransferase